MEKPITQPVKELVEKFWLTRSECAVVMGINLSTFDTLASVHADLSQADPPRSTDTPMGHGGNPGLSGNHEGTGDRVDPGNTQANLGGNHRDTDAKNPPK